MKLPLGKTSLSFVLNGNGGMYLQSGIFASILKNPSRELSRIVFDLNHFPFVMSGILAKTNG